MTTRLQGMQQRRAALLAEGKSILDAAATREDQKATSEENARLDAADAEIVALDADIMREQRHRDKMRTGSEERAVGEIATAVAARRANAINNAPRPFGSFGDQLIAIAHAATSARTGKVDQRLTAIADYERTVLAATGASEGVASDGGFLVQHDFASEVMAGMLAGGEVMNRVRRIPLSSGANGIKLNAIDETSRALGSRWAGVRAYWAAESATLTSSRPKFRRITLELNKVIGLFYATSELLQDASALESIASQGFTEELRFATEDAIIRGTGAGQPLGILSAGGVVSQAKETGQAAATIVSTNIMKMMTRMPARNFANAVWTINQEAFPQLQQMYVATGDGGQLVYMPPTGISASPYGTLYGRPVVPTEYNAALGTVGDIILADFSEYLMIEKSAPEWASSMHVQFLTDEMTYRMTYRVDGQPSLASAITPYKGSATQAHFVTLATRA